MTEQPPIDPGLDPTSVDPAAMDQELVQKQTAIRETVDAMVRENPVEDWMADEIAKKFGVEPGKYDVFIGGGVSNDGSFTKFVAKDDPADVLPGLTWVTPGGELSKTKHFFTSALLHGNGDITGSVISSDGETGAHRHEFAESATDPGQARSYGFLLKEMHYYAQDLAKKYEDAQSGAAEADQQHKSGLSRLLGRFATRRR